MAFPLSRWRLTGRRYKLPERESEGYGGREAEVKDEKIVKVTFPLDHDVTHGHLCIKGRFGWEWVNRRE